MSNLVVYQEKMPEARLNEIQVELLRIQEESQENHINSLREAGFKRLAHQKQRQSIHNKKMKEEELKAEKAGFLEISDEEYQILRYWLLKSNNIHTYEFTDVPADVVNLVKEHKNTFDNLEVLYLEGRYQDPATELDPALIGYAGNKRFLLARWGEIDPNHVTLEKLAKYRRLPKLAQLYSLRLLNSFDTFACWILLSCLMGLVGAFVSLPLVAHPFNIGLAVAALMLGTSIILHLIPKIMRTYARIKCPELLPLL